MVDTLTAFEFVTNVGVQYSAISLNTALRSEGTIPPSVLMTPIRGIGTSYKYIMAAQRTRERTGRIQYVVAMDAMSGRMSLTNPGLNGPAGVTISNFIKYMDSMLKKTKNDSTGLVFASPTTFLKFTNQEIIVFNVLLLGKISVIIVTWYLIPRVGRICRDYSKKLSQYTITYSRRGICKIRKLGSKTRSTQFTTSQG